MILQIILAWFYGHILEYLAHRYILHNWKIKLPFRNHFGNHHKICRKSSFRDDRYKKIFSRDSLFEIGTLTFLAVSHFPLWFFFPWAYATLVWSVLWYYIIHRKMHLDPLWAAEWTPWHYEHHMGRDQHDWWGVRLPVIDVCVKVFNIGWNKLFKRHI